MRSSLSLNFSRRLSLNTMSSGVVANLSAMYSRVYPLRLSHAKNALIRSEYPSCETRSVQLVSDFNEFTFKSTNRFLLHIYYFKQNRGAEKIIYFSYDFISDSASGFDSIDSVIAASQRDI